MGESLGRKEGSEEVGHGLWDVLGGLSSDCGEGGLTQDMEEEKSTGQVGETSSGGGAFHLPRQGPRRRSWGG